jgi:hypothetical protein
VRPGEASPLSLRILDVHEVAAEHGQLVVRRDGNNLAQKAVRIRKEVGVGLNVNRYSRFSGTTMTRFLEQIAVPSTLHESVY